MMLFKSYGRFIRRLIIPYTGVLSELDKNEKFIKKGIWGAIANTLSVCSTMREIKYLKRIYADYERRIAW